MAANLGSDTYLTDLAKATEDIPVQVCELPFMCTRTHNAHSHTAVLSKQASLYQKASVAGNRCRLMLWACMCVRARVRVCLIVCVCVCVLRWSQIVFNNAGYMLSGFFFGR